ncbi:nucleotide sugar dehydrogenase, partial [Candidatus Parcubacteria bacterium]|nr:nucleotide sugar dehydrogenase [Candidatus Parcubacteria bacterium]
VEKANQGKSYIPDVSSKDLREVIESKKFRAFWNHLPLKKSDIVLICVPTPLDKNKIPDLSFVKETTREISKYLHKNQLIILESTCPPETTRKVILPELEKKGLKVGKDFYLAHCPERIDPGNKKWTFKNIPRVVGGITSNCTKLAAKFYQNFVNAEIFPVSSPEVAEMAKLLENTFRLVNISMINEFALLCGKMGVDVWEVIEAAKTKPFGFMPFYPSPKVGGHCIPIVPFFVSFQAREYNFWARFIELAGEINEQMPHYVVTKVIWALNLMKKSVFGSKILVWGVAYKKDIGDPRESAAFDIIGDLIRKGAKVDYFDPYINQIKIEDKYLKKPVFLKSIKYSPEILKNYDLILILTDHSGFDYDELAQNSKFVVDTRNAIKSRKHKNVSWL